MPIKDKSKYPENWSTEVRPDILERDGYKCKFCSVPQYAVGYRRGDEFRRAGGNIHLFYAGQGLSFPSKQRIQHREARELADALKAEKDSFTKWIVIVLTIAHLDHNPANNEYSNLAALCQRCHLEYDKEQHKFNSAMTRREKEPVQDMFIERI